MVYGEKHPQIISLRAEIVDTEQRLRRETNNVLTGLRNEVETADLHGAAVGARA